MDSSGRPIALRLTMNPLSLWWELPLARLAGTFTGLIGWVLERPPVDDEVPAEVRSILLSSLCSYWKISFLEERAEPLRRRSFGLVTASDAEAAYRMFDAPGFDWNMRAQIGLLSPIDEPPPAVDPKQAFGVLDKKGPPAKTLLQNTFVRGLLLPGVDGDFAAISLFDNQWPQLVHTLEGECSQRNVDWDIISETQFQNSEWYTENQPPRSGAR